MKKIRSKNIVLSDRIISGEIHLENGIISKISAGISEGSDVFDLGDSYILAGFIDIHTHGGYGVNINSATKKEFIKLSKYFASCGVTGYLASIVADSKENTLKCINEVLCAMADINNGAKLLGIHLEGPFLNENYSGAIPKSHILKGNIELIREYQHAAKDSFKYITIAPEFSENLDLIESLNELGITVSLGHSDATYDETMEAFSRGAKSVTHLMNAMRPFHHREPGIIGAALMSDVYVELIIDGDHIDPRTIEFVLKNKGYDKIIAISDSIMATGLSDGDYMLGENEVVVVNGIASLKGEDSRAGSTLTMDKSLRNFMSYTNSDLINSQKLFNLNTAKLLGLQDVGEIKIGKKADFTVLNSKLDVSMTIIDGKIIYDKVEE